MVSFDPVPALLIRMSAPPNPSSAAATAADVIRIVDMIERLRAAVDGPVPVDRAYTAATVARLIEADDGLVLVSAGGFIAGLPSAPRR